MVGVPDGLVPGSAHTYCNMTFDWLPGLGPSGAALAAVTHVLCDSAAHLYETIGVLCQWDRR